MRRRGLTYCYRSLKQIRTSVLKFTCQLFVTGTLLVCIGAQIISPTGASFTDTVQVDGNLSVANEFKGQDDNDANTDIQSAENQIDDKRDNEPISKDNGQDQGVTIDSTEDLRDLERLEKTDTHLNSLDDSLQADSEKMDSTASNKEEKRSTLNRGDDLDEVENSR